MKSIKANKKISGYETKSFELDKLVPASIYKEIPEEEKLRSDLEQGLLQYPLIVFETDMDYWTKNHLKLYHAGSPELPEKPPILDGKIHVVWFGRQRYQILKKLDYTHVDVVVIPGFHQMVKIGQLYK